MISSIYRSQTSCPLFLHVSSDVQSDCAGREVERGMKEDGYAECLAQADWLHGNGRASDSGGSRGTERKERKKSEGYDADQRTPVELVCLTITTKPSSAH